MLEVEEQRDGRGAGRVKKQSRSGFTLVELSLAMTILVVALVSISAATLRSHALRRQNREHTLAYGAIRSISERIHSFSYITVENSPDTWVQDVLATYGPGGVVGNTFDIEGLNPVGANASVGSITFVTDETLSDADVGAELGLPRDLNGDLDATDNDVTGDARILPVVVTLNYQGSSGAVTLTHAFLAVGF